MSARLARELAQRLVAALPERLLRWAGALHNRHPLLGRGLRGVTRWMRTGAVTISHGPGTGLRFDPGGSNPGYGLGTNEPAVQRALATYVRPGGVFYDIGANVGFHTVIGARLVGPAGRVVAFEPIPSTAEALRRNLALNGFTNTEVIEGAVTARRGRALMLLGNEPTWARLAGSPGSQDAPAGGGNVEVETYAIDALIAQGRIARPTVVKIDAEGAEIDVLRGMAGVLRSDRPIIVCELHGTGREFVPLMREFDYRLAPLESDLPIESLGDTAHVLALPAAPIAPGAA